MKQVDEMPIDMHFVAVVKNEFGVYCISAYVQPGCASFYSVEDMAWIGLTDEAEEILFDKNVKFFIAD